MVSQLQGLVPDGFIYLAASPETCMRRMSARGRGEEGGVSLDYLSNLHSKHEEWLRQGAMRPEEYRLLSDASRNLVRCYSPLALPFPFHRRRWQAKKTHESVYLTAPAIW